jgi:hypothetical protein
VLSEGGSYGGSAFFKSRNRSSYRVGRSPQISRLVIRMSLGFDERNRDLSAVDLCHRITHILRRRKSPELDESENARTSSLGIHRDESLDYLAKVGEEVEK